MDFLKKYGLTDKQIDSIIDKYDYDLLELFCDASNNVQSVIEYMIDFGVNNIYEVLYHNLNIFLLTPSNINKIFNHYDKLELLRAIMYNPQIIVNLE